MTWWIHGWWALTSLLLIRLQLARWCAWVSASNDSSARKRTASRALAGMASSLFRTSSIFLLDVGEEGVETDADCKQRSMAFSLILPALLVVRLVHLYGCRFDHENIQPKMHSSPELKKQGRKLVPSQPAAKGIRFNNRQTSRRREETNVHRVQSRSDRDRPQALTENVRQFGNRLPTKKKKKTRYITTFYRPLLNITNRNNISLYDPSGSEWFNWKRL